jgi:hypothetical protein
MFAKWGEIKKNIKIIAFFMIGILGSMAHSMALSFYWNLNFEVWTLELVWN